MRSAMSFETAVQWWDDWQLRLLVLASLFLQYLLCAAAFARKLYIPHWFRALIWLAYQGSDVVAVYALATIFSRHREEALATNHASSSLEVLWAPILLLHLGGQDGITAYSIEDNENWMRHLQVSVYQIAIVIYVFCNSWRSGDKILLLAAILLFLPGILKCLEKPWALQNATVASIMNSFDPWVEETLESVDDISLPKVEEISSQEKYVQAAAESVANPEIQQQQKLPTTVDVADLQYHIFVDRGNPYSIRLQNLRHLASPDGKADAHDLVRRTLSKAFDRLYTNHKASFGGLLRATVVLVTFVLIGVFQRRHGGVYDRSDVVVTYVLLCCTAALELVSACLVLASGLPLPDDKLYQYNLVGYLARNEKHPWFWELARLLGARFLLDRLWCTAPPQPSGDVITRLVYDHVARGWKDYIRPMDETARDDITGEWRTYRTAVGAYRRFNDSRGQRTLEREGCRGRKAIEETQQMPFDVSVLLWHLATEFCYFDHVDTGHDATRHSRMVSNYMAYLLFVKPEMLTPCARSKLFMATYHELRKMLKPPPEAELEPTGKKARPPRSENEMVRKVIQMVKSTIGRLGSENVVHKAWAVANDLMEFANKKKEDFITEQRTRNKNMNDLHEAMDLARMKAEEFIKGNDVPMMKGMEAAKKNAEDFIKLEKNNKLTKEEERLTQLVESVKNKAEEFIKMENEKKQTKEENKAEDEQQNADVNMCSKVAMLEEKEKEKKMVKDFSNSVDAVIKEIEKKKQQLKDLVDRNLITNEEELLMIRAREHADDKMWNVIRGVWVEMLCFSAGRCRGYLHAESLANGGEYLSYVWLLLSYMGMETMPERMQRPAAPTVGDDTMPEKMMERPKLPVVGDTGALVKTSRDEHMDDRPDGEQNV